MTPIAYQLPNPFTNGKIIGVNVSHDEYAKQPDGVKRGDMAYVMSRGELLEFAACPHKWIKGVPKKVTSYMKNGAIVDCLTLTPDLADKRLAFTPLEYPCKPTAKDPRTSKPWHSSDYCDEWEARAEAEGKTVVRPSEARAAKAQVAALLSDPEAKELVDCSQKQVWVEAEYKDRATGLTIRFRVLFDMVPDKDHPAFGKCLADLKETTNANQKAWTDKVHSDALHVQAGCYKDVYQAAKPDEDRTDWWHLVQESEEPYESVIWPLSSDWVEIGRGQYQSALEMYCQCLKTGVWHGYNKGRNKIIQPKPYMLE